MRLHKSLKFDEIIEWNNLFTLENTDHKRSIIFKGPLFEFGGI